MFKFFGILLLLFIFGFLVLGVFLGKVIRSFSSSNTTSGSTSNTNNNSQTRTKRADHTNQRHNSSHHKLFSEDEGEYVNYEEIKE